MPSDEQALIELEERISARAAELKVYRELMRDRIYVNADGSITTSQERLCRLMAEIDRLTALLAERDAEIKTLVVRVAVLERAVEKAADWHSLPAHEFEGRWGNGWQDTSDGDDLIASDLRAALAARGVTSTGRDNPL